MTADSLGPAPSEAMPLWVALDEVSDPRNLGAILRYETAARHLLINSAILCFEGVHGPAA